MANLDRIMVDLITGSGTFYAGLLSQFKCIPSKELDTLGVRVRNGQVEMFYNVDFLSKLTDKEGVAVVTHECLHIVMDHIQRQGERKAVTEMGALWNVATDLAINQLLINLPMEALDVKMFGLPYDRSAEVYYDELLGKLIQNITLITPVTNGKRIGDHSKWKESDSTIGDAISEIVKEAVRRVQGSVPSNIQRYIEEITKIKGIPWNQVLRQWVAQSVKVGHRFSWKRPSKRFGEVQKGKISKRDIKIVVAVDTSGSIDEKVYEHFLSELNNLRSTYKAKLIMIQCDAKVQKVWQLTPYQPLPKEIHGRGGTDFRPVFDYIQEHRIVPDVLIYLTDMWGEFPASSKIKTLWVSWSGKKEAPFGKVVQINRED